MIIHYMWKVFLAFVCHRAFLFLVALATINAALAPNSPNRIQSTSVLISHFAEKIAETTEAKTLDILSQKPLASIYLETKNPFFWIAALLKSVTGLSSAWIVLILSNLFCLLFLWELYTLTSRMALPEVAVGTSALAMLWITSYELSLGSFQSLTCLLVTLVIRHALDNTWLLGGLALGILGLTDFLAVGLIPLLVILFWYYQRHEQLNTTIKRLLFFLLPLGSALAFRYNDLSSFSTQVQSSSIFTLVGFISQGDWNGLFSLRNMGQTISIFIFFIGTIITVVVNSLWLHRLIPAYLFTAVLLFSDFSSMGSRIIISAIVLEGVSAVSSNLVEKFIQVALIVVTAYEISVIF